MGQKEKINFFIRFLISMKKGRKKRDGILALI